jgi:uncharacterized membrane protein YgaE (UPF0421/DUF939 family)
MSSRNQSPRTVRIVGGLLAAVWLGAGFAAVFLAVFTSHWWLVAAGLIAFWYGLVWVRVARQGRLLKGREALLSWRVGQRSDA